ncbi:MAG: dTDP-glucose 4,6-dehydratase [Planctomycetota bacterium]
MKVLVTGGAGFIGVNFIHYLLETTDDAEIVNFDALTYAGNLASLADSEGDPRYRFVRGDVADREAVRRLYGEEGFDLVIHFAAESHVDRSILDATAFVRTNVTGTQTLLDAAREFGVGRHVQVSTDEVYGSLGPEDAAFTEETPLAPNSPYSASKAGADLLCRAAFHTHGQDVVITRCSNNYGPFQFPEKFIPLFITNALADESLPLYGDGGNIRDWIHVRDHSAGVWAAATKGEAGEVYNFGCDNEQTNLVIARSILQALGKPEALIRYVTDRPGHDRRYAMGFAKAELALAWSPLYDFETGLRETVAWYQEHEDWWTAVKSGDYREYYARQYGAGTER